MNKAQKGELLMTGVKVGLPIVGTAGLFFLGRSIYRNWKGKNSDGTNYSNAPSIEKLKVDYKNLTLTPDTLALMAQTLYQAMAIFGSDEDAIYAVFSKIKTKDDLLLLITKFGLRKNLWGARAAFIGQNVNLIMWLNEDLKDHELDVIRPVFETFGIPL